MWCGAPVQDIIADDTQVYVCINVCSQSDAIQKLQACFQNKRDWSVQNGLKLN